VSRAATGTVTLAGTSYETFSLAFASGTIVDYAVTKGGRLREVGVATVEESPDGVVVLRRTPSKRR